MKMKKNWMFIVAILLLIIFVLVAQNPLSISNPDNLVAGKLITYNVNYICTEETKQNLNKGCFELIINYDGKEFRGLQNQNIKISDYILAIPEWDAKFLPNQEPHVQFNINEKYELINNDVLDLRFVENENELNLNQNKIVQIDIINNFYEGVPVHITIIEQKTNLLEVDTETESLKASFIGNHMDFKVDTSEVENIQYTIVYSINFEDRIYSGDESLSREYAIGKDLIGNNFPTADLGSIIEKEQNKIGNKFLKGIYIIIGLVIVVILFIRFRRIYK